MKTCTKCGCEKSLTNYYKSSNRVDGYQSACKTCSDAEHTVSRKKNQAHYTARAKSRRQQHTTDCRLWKEARGCAVCGELYGPCLELHHLDPSTKETNPALYMGQSFNAFKKEAEKCVVLCANCHRKVHGGMIELSHH